MWTCRDDTGIGNPTNTATFARNQDGGLSSMDAQTAGALLPAFLIVAPLILAIIDRATITKSRTAMTGRTTTTNAGVSTAI